MHVQSQSVFCLLPSPVLRVSAVDWYAVTSILLATVITSDCDLSFWKSVSSYTTRESLDLL